MKLTAWPSSPKTIRTPKPPSQDMKKLTLLPIALAALMALTTAKASDFGTWTDAGVTKKLGNFSVSLDGGLRLQNNLKSVDRWSIGIGGEYKPVKFFAIGASYNFIYNYKYERRENKYDTWNEFDDNGNQVTVTEYDGYNVKKPFWRCKNRFNFDLTGKLPVGRFTFTLRERYQFTRANRVKSNVDKYRMASGYDEPQYKRTDIKVRDAKNDSRLRSKLEVDYNIRHCPLNPYAYIEIANDMRRQMQLDRTRVGIGTDIKLNKQNKLSIGYVYQDSNDDDYDGTQHVIDISYKFKF